MPTAPTSSVEFVELIRKSGVVRPEKLAGLPELPPDPQKAAAVLVSQGILTRFQAQQLLAGRYKGFRVGSYAILDLLGRGGMGAVYLAEHLELHRKVALKVLVPGRDDDQKLALERFLREARAAAALDHPNIVRIFDVCRQGETPYLVMEYVEGETLQQVLDRDGPIPYPTAAEYIAQAAAGLQHAHEKGFVHRDIKPANLMRDRSGTIKILDMGLARSGNSRDKLTEQLDQGAVVGTADFIAPEQGLNQPHVDIRADIYSLGATFFALLVGKPPFEGNTTQKLLQHQLKAPPSLTQLDPSLPPGLAAVVAKMMAKKPADRYQTPAEVIAALTPWLGTSARILAGLSRTNLAQGADLQAALAEIARRSSQRLPRVQPGEGGAPELLEVSGPEADTVPVSAAATTRSRPGERPDLPPALPRLSPLKVAVLAGLGLVLVGAGVLAAWVVFGDRKPSAAAGPDVTPRPVIPAPADTGSPAKPPADPPTPTPPPDRPTPPPANQPPAAYRLDLASQPAFTIRCGLLVDPADPGKKLYRPISHTGGQPPDGWSARPWHADTEMEYFAAEVNGRPSLGIRNVSGPGSAMLFAPRVPIPDGYCRIRFEYRADLRDSRFALRFKPADPRPAWDVARPPATGTAWRTEELEVDLRGANAGYFEFHNTDEQPTAALYIRAFEITPQPRKPEKTHYVFDAATLPDFEATLQGGTVTAGSKPALPAGVNFVGWKRDTLSHWRGSTFAGSKAIAYTNLNNPTSAQIALELERPNGLGLKFRTGHQVRVRVVYRTTGQGAGRMYFQAYDYRTGYGSTTLPNSNSAWQTIDTLTVRGELPLRFLIDATATGQDNLLIVRSITVSESEEAVGAPPPLPTNPNPPPKTPPSPKVNPNPPPQTPPPPATPEELALWAEGPTLYTFDPVSVPEFRVQKEPGKPPTGEPERLPTGVFCHTWKEGSVGEFACRTVGGAAALGLTNLNEVTSAQYVFRLDRDLKLPLRSGHGYRVKFRYLTRNEAAGTAIVHTIPGFTWIGMTKLENTGGEWREATVSFIRPPTEEKPEVQFTINNTTVGEGNTLWFRDVRVVELVPPSR